MSTINLQINVYDDVADKEILVQTQLPSWVNDPCDLEDTFLEVSSTLENKYGFILDASGDDDTIEYNLADLDPNNSKDWTQYGFQSLNDFLNMYLNEFATALDKFKENT